MPAPVVLVIGGSNLDSLAVSTAAIQTGTSNPGRRRDFAGGVGRNVAENLARLGTRCRLVTALGDDPAGDRVAALTSSAGVELIRLPYDGATGTYTALIDADGSLLAGVADMAATDAIAYDDIPLSVFDDVGWVVIDGNLAATTVRSIAEEAGRRDIPVVLDPVSAPKAARLDLSGLRLHTITPTADEAEALDHDLSTVADTVWLREGAAGSRLLQTEREPVAIRLPPVSPVDVTGAGDAMLAGYVHRLGQGADQIGAAWFGAAAALLTVLSSAPVDPALTEASVQQVLRDHQKGSAP